MRYIISIMIIIIGVILFATNISGSIVGFIRLLNLPTFIFVGLFPFLFVSTLIGFKKMKTAFSISRNYKPDKDILIQSMHFFKTYGKAVWITGFIGSIIELINLMSNFDDKGLLPISLAMALLCIFYSRIINMIIVIPYTTLIKMHLNEY